MGYIWTTAFDDDYEAEYDFLSNSTEAQQINVSIWTRGLTESTCSLEKKLVESCHWMPPHSVHVVLLETGPHRYVRPLPKVDESSHHARTLLLLFHNHHAQS